MYISAYIHNTHTYVRTIILKNGIHNIFNLWDKIRFMKTMLWLVINQSFNARAFQSSTCNFYKTSMLVHTYILLLIL